MTDDDARVGEALRMCADVHLPDDFADRLVKRIREIKENEGKKSPPGSAFTRIALVAASMTLLLGFVPTVLDRASDGRDRVAARCDGIRAADPTPPQDGQLDALALLGFCREVIRRRVRPLLGRGRKREEGE